MTLKYNIFESIKMGKNAGDKRIGAIKNRQQTFNPKTGQFIKRDTVTGKIMASKSTPYKGIRKDSNAKKQIVCKKK
jgi:hypothetical protein